MKDKSDNLLGTEPTKKVESNFLVAIQATGFNFFFILLGLFLFIANDQFRDILFQANNDPLNVIAICVSLLIFSFISWGVARLILEYSAGRKNYFSKRDGFESNTYMLGGVVSRKVIEWLPRAYGAAPGFIAAIAMAYFSQTMLAIGTFIVGIITLGITSKRTDWDQESSGDSISFWKVVKVAAAVTTIVIYLLVLFVALFHLDFAQEYLNPGFVVFVGLGSLLLGLTGLAYAIHIPQSKKRKPAKIFLYTLGLALIPNLFAWIGSLIWYLSGDIEIGRNIFSFAILFYVVLFAYLFAVLAYRIAFKINLVSQENSLKKLFDFERLYSLRIAKFVSYSIWAALVVGIITTSIPLGKKFPPIAIYDNHQVERLENQEDRYSNKKMLEAWGDYKRFAVNSNKEKSEIPVFFVLSQGGGLRASYWSNVVLTNLGDDFSNNIFALFGVSGGSLGNAYYVASVNSGTNTTALEGLRKDHLTRVTTSFLYNDLMYRFFPIHFFKDYATDRARHLEKSWEQGWTGDQNKGLALGLKALYKNNGQERWLPIWLSMGTIQETGQRVVTSPVILEEEIFADVKNYFALNDFNLEKGVTTADYDIKLSTAALNSARFPFVTPPGAMYSLNDEKNLVRTHVIDGGYFDNFGSEVLKDFLNYLDTGWQSSKEKEVKDPLEFQGVRFVPYVIVIDNNLEKAGEEFTSTSRHRKENQTWSLVEVTSPIQGIVQSRPGHTIKAVESLGKLGILEKERVFRFSLPSMKVQKVDTNDNRSEKDNCSERLSSGKLEVPLGWWLSKVSTEYMEGIDKCKNLELVHQTIQKVKAIVEE